MRQQVFGYALSKDQNRSQVAVMIEAQSENEAEKILGEVVNSMAYIFYRREGSSDWKVISK